MNSEMDGNEQLETEVDADIDTGIDTDTDTGQEVVKPEVTEPPKKMSVRESIQDALKKAAEPPKTDKKPPKKGAAAPGQKAGEQGSTPTQGVTGEPTSPPPDAWKSKELAPVWSGLPQAVQAAITKREADMAKGVESLKTRYQELDGAVAPYRDSIKRFGFTESQAVDQLFKWQMALAGPDKVTAFVALMRSHGIDPATIFAANPGPQAASLLNNGEIPPHLLTKINSLEQKVGQFDQHFASQTKSAAEQTVMTWAKDKPHYTAVRQLMGQLIQSGAVPLNNGNVDLDAAYQMAVHANQETRELVAQEQRVKEVADRKAALDKAKRAASSMRTGAPVPPAQPNGAGKLKRDESVRDSIKNALTELRTQ